MKTVLFYILLPCLVLKFSVGEELGLNPKANEYLKEKVKTVTETFSGKLKKVLGDVEIEEHASSSHNISGSYRSIFSFFNETFIFLDNQVYHMQTSNETMHLTALKEPTIKGNIMFTKATQFHNLGLMLIKKEVGIDIYGYRNNKIFFMHSIFTPKALDAHFFINQDSLYLIVVNNNGDDLAISNIYRWLGTYFDEKQSIFTTGAIKVTSFTYNSFEIIIILQYSPNREMFSTVYEFNYEKIKKIQHVRTENPIGLDVYQTETAKCVLIFESSKNNLAYKWDGTKLVLVSQFETETVINKALTITTNKSSIIVVPVQNKVQTFRILSKETRLIGESNSSHFKVVDIHKGANMSNSAYVISFHANTLYISKMSFMAHFRENPVKTQDTLQDCFYNLEIKMYHQKTKRKEIKEILKHIRINPKQESTNNLTLTVGKNAENSLENLKDRMHKLENILNDYRDNDTVINQKVTIKGSIEAEKVTGKNMDIKTINGQTWEPQHWLKYKQTQNITAPISINKIITKELHTTTSDPLFTDILTKNGDQIIQGKFEIVNLTANKIFTEKINDIPVKDIYVKNNPQPVQGRKTFENLKVRKAKVGLLNDQLLDTDHSMSNSSSSNVSVFNNLDVENLLVDSIDDIHWDNFKNRVFRIGITTEINGDLTFQKFKADNMTLKTLKGVKVEDLFTTSTDQVIDADMEFFRISAGNVTTNTTNDINLKKSAVHFENNTFVEGPVKFDQLHVRQNLELTGEIDEDFFVKNGDHILGTNESDLWQTYEGIVHIRGNLYVKNFTLQPHAQLFIDGEEFDPNLRYVYWTKNTTQSIPNHFKAENGIRVPHLALNKLNNINFSQYMLNKDEDTFENTYHFKNVTILGNIFLNNRSNHTPNLMKLDQESVKTNGSYYVTGKKIYTDTLSVKNLDAPTLGGVGINETLTTKSTANITAKKSFKNVIIKGNLSCNVQSLKFINGLDINKLLENTIYIDEPQNIRKLNFKNITVEDLWAAKLNNHNVTQYIQNMEKILASDKISSLKVIGNVVLNNVTGVSTINNIQFDELLSRTWKLGKTGGMLVNLRFLDHVKVNNLITFIVNDINLKNLSKRLLYKHIDQNITAAYSFKNIKAENLVVSKINNISTENLIDVSIMTPQTIYAPSGIEFSSTVLQKSLNITGTSPCDMVAALKALVDPPAKKWTNVKVKGNATFLDPTSILYRVFEKTVTTNTKNVIREPVKFSKHIMAENVFTEGHINNVNLKKIIDDAVLKNSEEEQIITGRKVFPTLGVSIKATVVKNTDIPVVNNVDMPELNTAIVRKDDAHSYIIQGNKTFSGGLKCDYFYSEKMLKMDVNNIVSTEKLRKIPSAIFNTFEVENDLNISSINSFDFERFLKTRLLTQGDEQTVNGVCYIDNLEVEHMEVPSINNITMNNVVFDIGQQNISSPKRFAQDVDVFGNISCALVNGINLAELYKKSIQDDDTINGSMTILRPSIVKGSITTDNINGYPVEHIKKILSQDAISSRTEEISRIIEDIEDRIKYIIPHIEFLARDYMYIEKTRALQISVPNTKSASTMESKGYVLIHVNGEESGSKCGLPEKCKCPVQYSIQISPENSVTAFPNKGFQRIFTYFNDDVIVNFLTNSVSTSSDCRSKDSKVLNEVSMMTWNIVPKANNSGGFYQYQKYITGYISGAEFFKLHGQTYAIIGRYYDPTLDRNDLECYLIKINQDKNTAEEVQRISTRGAWSVYLFHTAQGVILVIGNIKYINAHHTEEDTEIYRFNEKLEKFVLLRVVPSYGCSMATGVVLSTDSLIILAHRYAPPQVLKYNQIVDNYYFYQSFELEAPVIGISVFYTGGFGISDAYLCTVTANENYFIYSFRFIEGWKLESSGELEGLRNLIPFELNKQTYLFAASSKISSLLSVVKHGSV